MGYIVTFVVLVFLIAILGSVITALSEFLTFIKSLFNKLILPELPNPSTVLFVPDELNRIIYKYKHESNVIEQSPDYDPYFDRIPFEKPKKPLDIDSPRYLESPYFDTLSSGTLPHEISTREIEQILSVFPKDEFVIGKSEMFVSSSNIFDFKPAPPRTSEHYRNAPCLQ